jgi:hypothetical protein
MKPSLAMTDKLITVDGTKKLLEDLAREGAEQSLSPFYGFFNEEEMEDIIASATETVSMPLPQRVQSTYGEQFNGEDMLNMIAFFKTPTGKKMAGARSPLMLRFMMALNQVVDEVSTACVKEALKRVIDKHEEN